MLWADHDMTRLSRAPHRHPYLMLHIDHDMTRLSRDHHRHPYLMLHIDHDVARLSRDHHRRQLCLNQRPDIIYQLLTDIGPVLRDPLQRDFFLDIRNLMYIVEIRRTNVGITGHAR